MNEQDLIRRIHLLEYHQKLLLKIIVNPQFDFYRLIVEKGISEQETEAFYKLCDRLCTQMEEQKAEGFLHFYPLFNEFAASLPSNFQADETVRACLTQDLFPALMHEFKKYM